MCCMYIDCFGERKQILNYPEIIDLLHSPHTEINDVSICYHLLYGCPSDLVIKKNKHYLPLQNYDF